MLKRLKGNLQCPRWEKTLFNSNLDGKPASEREKAQRAYFVPRKTIHQRGIAHNDLHGGNAFLKPDGSVGLVDFGLAQVGFKYALIEAMGFANGDFPVQALCSPWTGLFDRDSKTYKTLLSNRQKALDYMKQKLGLDWDKNYTIPNRIRTSESKMNNSLLANLTDTEIQKILSILYEGI
jgi:serine/threonine protein kinase